MSPRLRNDEMCWTWNIRRREHCLAMQSKLVPTVLLLLLCSAPSLMRAAPATGITEAISDVTLSASVPGIVSAWKFKEGEFVKAGDTIIELDNKLEELEAHRRKLAMENKREEWESLDKLSRKSSISVKKEELEKAESEFKIATAEYEMAAEQLRRRSIFAPCPGAIAEITRHVGEACQPYQPLVHLVDTRQCYFVSNVEARLAAQLKLDQSVKLEVETGAAPVAVAAKVIFISPVVDPASSLVKVRAVFDNAEGKVRPGLAAKLVLD